ncbi:MAG: PIN domain-containing protein [Prevotellaceae bacterium]|jgi:PIN domain nuclease of toxin-antitoxin system|nr:PIN domain-containing protein [Prevotellaceae bacterium]
MRYFIDTNLLADFVAESYISPDIYRILDNYETQIYVSSEVVKEFIHLVQNGKVAPKKKIHQLDIVDFIENSLGFNVKYVAKEHLRTFAKLDTVEGHNDPNDRLIIAQAITEKLPLISSDRHFTKYIKAGLDFIPNYR